MTDIVPLRRMLGTDSLVIRVGSDGTLAPFDQMPTWFFDRAIRDARSEASRVEFSAACQQAIDERRSVAFRSSAMAASDEIMINPVLDDQGNECRFLVCWSRRVDVIPGDNTSLSWSDLNIDQVVTRYRCIVRPDQESVVEAAPWWRPREGELVELWPHHARVSAMGLAHALVQTLILDATGEAAHERSVHPNGPSLRIEIPSADMLVGLVPIFHGAVRSSGIDPSMVTVAMPVGLGVDPDLLPIIVHLHTLGLRIDLVGLDALATTLSAITRGSSSLQGVRAAGWREDGPWVDRFADAQAVAA